MVLGMARITDRDRKIARGLPDEFRKRTGTALERMRALVDANWNASAPAQREALAQRLLAILEPLHQGAREVDAAVRVQCVEAVADWIAGH